MTKMTRKSRPRPKPARQPSARAGRGARRTWRQTLDAWGGLTIVGPVIVAILVVGALVLLNRPNSGGDSDTFVLREHGAAAAGRVLGDPNAPVRLIEYSDYQCPFCKRFWATTELVLIEEYVATGLASLEYRDYAFLGPESMQAAEAARCAADQEQYWNFHDLLFTRQGRENAGAFSLSNLKRYAEQLRAVEPAFNVDTWEACLAAGTYKADIIESQQSAVAEYGIRSTPTLLVNGQAIEGALDADVYRAAIEAALVEAGVARASAD